MDSKAKSVSRAGHPRRAGFGMFEVLIASAISAIIVLSVGKFSDAIFSIGVLLNNKLQADQELAVSLDAMESELRGMAPSEAGAYALETAASGTLVFYSDIDQDGQAERVRYSFASSSFEKGVIEPSGVPAAYPSSTETKFTVAPSIIPASSTFEYFGASYTGSEPPLAPPVPLADVRVVRVTLVAEVSTSTAPRPIALTNTITIRNLRSN